MQYIQSYLQLDIKLLLEKTIRSAVIHQVKGINRALVSEEKEDGESVLHLKTEGVNILVSVPQVYPCVVDVSCSCFVPGRIKWEGGWLLMSWFQTILNKLVSSLQGGVQDVGADCLLSSWKIAVSE